MRSGPAAHLSLRCTYPVRRSGGRYAGLRAGARERYTARVCRAVAVSVFSQRRICLSPVAVWRRGEIGEGRTASGASGAVLSAAGTRERIEAGGPTNSPVTLGPLAVAVSWGGVRAV